MDFHLIDCITDSTCREALVFYFNNDSRKTVIKKFDIADGVPKKLTEIEVAKSIRSVIRRNDRWVFAQRDNEKDPKCPARLITNDWNTLESILETEIEDNYFPRRICLAEDGKTVVLCVYKDWTVRMFNLEGMIPLGSVEAENFSAVGTVFNCTSDKSAFVNLDQGGGCVVVAAKTDGMFKEVLRLGHDQINDDFSLTANIVFCNDDSMIVSTVYNACTFHVVKYDIKNDGAVLWETKFENAYDSKFLSEQDIDEEEYSDMVWNNYYQTAICDNRLYLGANKKIVVVDIETGKVQEKMKINLQGFVVKLLLLKESNRLFAVDNLGEVATAPLLDH